MEGQRTLITGGAGLVGSHIANQLVRAGAREVVVLDNFVRGRRANLAWALVGMGAVVTDDVPAGEVWAGVPARFLRRVAEPSDPPAQPAPRPLAG